MEVVVRWGMKKAIAVLFLLAVVLAATPVLGQEKTEVITVKSVEVYSRVVIVAVEGANKRVELQCDRSIPDCNALQPGSYIMVRLPENSGPYVYPNVEVYPMPANPEHLGQKLGAYCLIEK